jgi:hypothetical protein
MVSPIKIFAVFTDAFTVTDCALVLAKKDIKKINAIIYGVNGFIKFR